MLQDIIYVVTALLVFVFPLLEAGVWEWTNHLLWWIYWRINLGNSQSFRVIFNDGNDSRRKKTIADYICPKCCRCVMPFIRLIQVLLEFPLQLEDVTSLKWTLSLLSLLLFHLLGIVIFIWASSANSVVVKMGWNTRCASATPYCQQERTCSGIRTDMLKKTVFNLVRDPCTKLGSFQKCYSIFPCLIFKPQTLQLKCMLYKLHRMSEISFQVSILIGELISS